MRLFFRAARQVKEIQALHRPKRLGRYHFVCKADGQSWPCRTAQIVLD